MKIIKDRLIYDTETATMLATRKLPDDLGTSFSGISTIIGKELSLYVTPYGRYFTVMHSVTYDTVSGRPLGDSRYLVTPFNVDQAIDFAESLLSVDDMLAAFGDIIKEA